MRPFGAGAGTAVAHLLQPDAQPPFAFPNHVRHVARAT